ncbi:alpha/beta hydrolase [Actinoplanes sp. ATCC 53533]|uniref:alpha/beta hydrolase n=1 Tax=Actinoplanes sp. ATCC 53533 TaxID=1288362 RepID=UPI000F77C0D6|nr:alpha/beta fold hydrolase [Actinoplanes sp. ATCC 53533]RSM56519.1 alpha/beta hydrolase [Actinoplanes sp. ATCC 53533]
MVKVSGPVRVVLVVLLFLALVVAVAWLLQRRLIHFPDASAPPPAAQVVAGAQDVVLHTDDGLRLGAWLVKPQPSAPDRRLAVLVAHGNAGNRQGRVPLAVALAGHGLTVLLVDYRGYGGNPGSPSEEGLARDVQAARSYLVDRAGIPAERLIYYGESLGAAVVTALAARHPPAALVLRSPFTDLPAAGREHYPFLPVRLFLRDRFPVGDLIAQVTAPTLIVYGTADTVVPPAQSVTVADRAAGPVRIVAVEGADHNDASLLNGPQLINAITELAGEIK